MGKGLIDSLLDHIFLFLSADMYVMQKNDIRGDLYESDRFDNIISFLFCLYWEDGSAEKAGHSDRPDCKRKPQR